MTSRHADARRAYQRRYNAIHRLGRRKISKAARQELQNRREDELHDWTAVYTNEIIRKSPPYDPRCLPWMRRAERDAWNSLSNMEDEMRNAHGKDWLDAWCAEVASTLPLMADQMRGPLPELPDCAYQCSEEETPEDVFRHHQRRMIALHHQFVNLLWQGVEAIQQATYDNALIVQGRCPKVTSIKKLYGV
ncbi:hypothetical protein CERSUDRAFT_76662 [Gelatoporia subvermispora B]|uniref:Uncharacterized protein n=1 Tax=Ceriporiopsis subvermispora (strain B) TaxID=914234 RepID=M2QMR5_CERS8|nr:hypothetical protein CERSUDRAFT_76662 [Gelatoporia subvermispora B]